jgi:hypothetical protein
MTPETLDALNASISKWEKNASVTNLDKAVMGSGHCPLCRLFHPDYTVHDKADCYGCPVKRKTRKPYCRGTPYPDAEDAQAMSDLPAYLDAAKAELSFLRSLLPEASK